MNSLRMELNRVNELQIRADEANKELIAGESEDIHSVLLALKKLGYP